jgi:hypothetical protein
MNDGAKTLVIAAAINPKLIGSMLSGGAVIFIMFLGLGIILQGMHMWLKTPIKTWIILSILVSLYKLINYMIEVRTKKVASLGLVENKSFSINILTTVANVFLLTPIYILWVTGLIAIAKSNWTSLLIGLFTVVTLYFLYDFFKPFANNKA